MRNVGSEIRNEEESFSLTFPGWYRRDSPAPDKTIQLGFCAAYDESERVEMNINIQSCNKRK